MAKLVIAPSAAHAHNAKRAQVVAVNVVANEAVNEAVATKHVVSRVLLQLPVKDQQTAYRQHQTREQHANNVRHAHRGNHVHHVKIALSASHALPKKAAHSAQNQLAAAALTNVSRICPHHSCALAPF